MEGGFYFSTSRSFGFIDNPPWAASKAAGKEYYEVGRAALQRESDEAYLVVDYRNLPENFEGRVYADHSASHGQYINGAEHGEEELRLDHAVSERGGYGYGYGYGEWPPVAAEAGSASASSSSTSCSSHRTSAEASFAAADEICMYIAGGRAAPPAPPPLHHGFYSQYIDGSPASLPPTIFSSSPSWLDLDSPDSLVHLQDIDDSWLDSLPPLHINSSSSSSNSSVSSSSSSSGGSASAPLLVPASPAPGPLLPLYLLNNPNPFDGFPDSISPASFEASPVSLDISPAPRDQPASPAPLPSPQPPDSPSPAAARASLLSSDRKRLKRLDLSEPKYVVLTRNYESVLKDGFKWRKYGQKSVKNNIYPRSYYKCSYEGCYVHKHVERVALDPCLILTTYRGRHTH